MSVRHTVVLGVAIVCWLSPNPVHPQQFPELPADRIIESRVGDAERWVLRLELEIGSATSQGPEQFFRITDARMLDAASLMVADAGSGEIRVFDFTGAHLRSFGGIGKGPGEFTYLAGLHTLGGTVLAIDFSPRQVSRFTRDGQFLQVMRLAEGRDIRWPTPLGFLADGTVIAVNGQSFESGQMGLGLVRPPFEMLEVPAVGAGSARRITTFPGTEFWVTREQDQVTTKRILGPETLHAVGGSSFWLASSDNYRIWRFSSTGEPELLVRVPVAAGRPGPEEIEARVEERLSRLEPGPMRVRTSRAFSAMPTPERKPVIQRLVVASNGGLWVMLANPAGRAAVEWHVFDSAGRLRGALVAPSNFQITEILGDRVIGIWRNELDVEFIRVYTVDRSPT